MIFKLLAALLAYSAVSSAATRVELADRQGTRLDLEQMHFHDETGADVPLSRYFHHGRPVVMALVYFACPRTCSVLLNNFVGEINRVGPTTGVDYDFVAVSIDPADTPAIAGAKKANYLKLYGRAQTQPAASGGWHFLTGNEGDITRLTDSLGFYFAKDPTSGLLNHPSAIFFLTAEGKLAQTLPGLNYSKRDLLIGLYRSSHGVVENFTTRFSQVCMAYFPEFPIRSVILLALLACGFFALFLRALRPRAS